MKFVAGASGARPLRLASLLRPHWWRLAAATLAVLGESAANLLEPWPLKIVVDNVLKPHPAHGWLTRLVLFAAGPGAGPMAVLRLAALAALAIACLGAVCSFAERYLTTSVGQWVMHDLRRGLYSHIQKLSLAFHDNKQTGDLLSRATSDIDAIQSFIASGLLGPRWTWSP
jgi:subfamily B ATP-binding cassette protein MsbA